MYKSLIYVFGPDGGGKSTVAGDVANGLQRTAYCNASDPATWPDLSWRNEVMARGLDMATLDPSVHVEAMRRCYQAANGLLRLGTVDTVVIDSDLRAKAAVKAKALYGYEAPLAEIYGQLCAVTNAELDEDVQQLGLHVTIGGTSLANRATLLMGRLSRRGGASFYDPTSVEQAQALIAACDELETTIIDNGGPVMKIETSQEYNPREVVGAFATLLALEQ